MAFEYQYYSNNYWSENDPGIRTLIGIKNSGNITANINKLYILNSISNYQENNCIQNFCIHLYNLNFSEITTNGAASYNIPYPNYYPFEPGNVAYDSLGVLPQSKSNYKSLIKFILNPGQTYYFEVAFNPKRNNIDFYRANLIIEYAFGYDFPITLSHEIKADYIPNIDSVDGKSFPDVCISINGVNSNNVLLVQ